jgi:hypothetical protein
MQEDLYRHDPRLFISYAQDGSEFVAPLGANPEELLVGMYVFQLKGGLLKLFSAESKPQRQHRTPLMRRSGYGLWYMPRFSGQVVVTRLQTDSTSVACAPTVIDAADETPKPVGAGGVPVLPDVANIVLLGHGLDAAGDAPGADYLRVIGGFATTPHLDPESLGAMMCNMDSVKVTTLRIAEASER